MIMKTKNEMGGGTVSRRECYEFHRMYIPYKRDYAYSLS